MCVLNFGIKLGSFIKTGWCGQYTSQPIVPFQQQGLEIVSRGTLSHYFSQPVNGGEM
jgi:hypothetical protein